MGYFEAVLVVYLRGLIYPGGFAFPLKDIPVELGVFELFREAATIIMLISIAGLTAKKFWERFGYFIILFGIWDIFYYIWLKVTINWPASLFESDILFLIPMPWIGPVIAPVLVAVLMVVIGIVITYIYRKGSSFKPSTFGWILAATATVLILYSFINDIDAGFKKQTPKPYGYGLLFAGLILYILAFLHSYGKQEKIQDKES